MTKISKILMIVENIPAPHDRRVWPEARALREHGYQVSVISPKGVSDCRESYCKIDDIHIYRYALPAVGKKYIAYAIEYSVALLMTFWLSLKVLFQHGFDVVHVANPPDIFFIIGMLYRPFGKKFIFDQHDLSPEMFQVIFNRRSKFVSAIMRFLERCSYKMADLVIVTNESQKKCALKRGHCRPERVFVVRNSSNLGQLKAAFSESNVDSDTRQGYTLGYVGVMGIQDGVNYTLYALDELVHRRGRKDVVLVLMGDGADLPALRNLAHELGLTGYVKFTGWLSPEEMERQLGSVDIGLVPDPQNGLNELSTMLKTMDYMALGKPVVAFDLAETRFSAQDAGLYATPNRVEDFANQIELLLDDKELRIRKGQIGQQRFRDELSWEHSKKCLLSAYATLLLSRNASPRFYASTRKVVEDD